MDYLGYLSLQERLRAGGFEEMIEAPWCDRVSCQGAMSRMAKRFYGFRLEYEASWARKPDREELSKPTGMREMVVEAAFITPAVEASRLLLSSFADRDHSISGGDYRARLVFHDDPVRLRCSCFILCSAIAHLDAGGEAPRVRLLREALDAVAAATGALGEGNPYRSQVGGDRSALSKEMESLLEAVRSRQLVHRAMEEVMLRSSS